MKKLLSLLLCAVILCTCAAPAFAASGVIVKNKKLITDVEEGESFKYTVPLLCKGKLTIKTDDGFGSANNSTVRIKITNQRTGKVVFNNIINFKYEKTLNILSSMFPRSLKKTTYKITIIDVTDNTGCAGTPTYTASVSTGTLSK